jgi:apolipoprotein N-acyltransferase
MKDDLEKLNESSRNRDTTQIMVLFVVAIFLIFTSLGTPTLLFWVALGTMLSLFVWFLVSRKVWLATVSGLTFLTTIFATASKLY